MKLTEVKPDRAKVLLIGNSGTGKTSQTASLAILPEIKKIWVASFDGGVASMLSTFKRLGVTPEKCDVDVDTYIEDDRTIPRAYKDFIAALNVKLTQDYDLIVLDGFGFLSKYCFWDIVAVNNLTDKKYGDASYHLYRLLMDKLSDVITKSVRSSKFVVATCLLTHEADQNSGEMFVFPDVEGKSTRQALQGWFDEVYYTAVTKSKDGQNVYQMLTQPDGKYIAKTRWGGDVLKAAESRNLGECVKAIMDYYR